MENSLSPLPPRWKLQLGLFRRLFAVLRLEVERDGPADDFLECDAREFVFDRVDVYSRTRAALKLFTALRRQDNQTVF